MAYLQQIYKPVMTENYGVHITAGGRAPSDEVDLLTTRELAKCDEEELLELMSDEAIVMVASRNDGVTFIHVKYYLATSKKHESFARKYRLLIDTN